MKNRLIEKTNEELSPIGFGAMRLPLKKGKIDREIGKKQIYHAIEKGINIIDTAATYGEGDSEKFLGEILQDKYKDKVKISTKLPVYKIKNYDQMEKTLNKQLERLQRDSIDYYLLHNIDLNSFKRIQKIDVFKFLEKAQKEGKIKHIGFSYHGKIKDFQKVVDGYSWDVVMVQYNYFDDNIKINIESIKYAAQKGMGIFIMEPLKGGILTEKIPKKAEEIFKNENNKKTNAEWSFEWILNHPEITTVFSGMNSINQINENINIANRVTNNSLSDNDLKIIEKVKKVIRKSLKIDCASCGYCMPCPKGVNIAECIMIYNEKYLFEDKKIIPPSLIRYFSLVGGIINEPANAGLCNSCGKCIRKCPQNINIPKELKKVKKEMEGHGFNFKRWIVKKIALPIYQKFKYNF